MFQQNGAPEGYDQQQPFLDVPNQSRPPKGQPASPLQSAIRGDGPSQYPTDPHMLAWRQRKPGKQPQIQPHVNYSQEVPLPQAGGSDFNLGAVTGGNTGFAGGLDMSGGFHQLPVAPEAHLDAQATGQIAPPAAVPATPPPLAAAIAPMGHPSQFRDKLAGFDNTKLNNGHDSIKYQAAHVFENFAPTKENMPAVLQALKAAGMNVDQIGKDSFDFHDGAGPVDVGYGFGAGGDAAHWQWLNKQQQPAAVQRPLLSAVSNQTPLRPDPSNDYVQQLIQQLLGQQLPG